MSEREVVYFFESPNKSIYVGSSKDWPSRKAAHLGACRSFLAYMPGSKAYEDRMHKHFRMLGADRYREANQSEYDPAALLPYISALLSHGMATQDEGEIEHVPDLLWQAIDPATIKPSTSVHTLSQIDLFADDRPTSTFEALRRSNKFACYSSNTDEWYTPPDVIEAARQSMGSIDLDPASCPVANRVVRASIYYSMRVDGLSRLHPWSGNVWLNPPYGGQAQLFVSRLLEELASGHVLQGIALLSSQTVTTAWCDSAIRQSSAVGFSRGRWEFAPGNGQKISSPAGGSMLLYYGPRVPDFARCFDSLAHVMCMVNR